jgi:hypothetical protein
LTKNFYNKGVLMMNKMIYALIAFATIVMFTSTASALTTVNNTGGAAGDEGKPIQILPTGVEGVFNFTPSPKTLMGVACNRVTFSVIGASKAVTIENDGMEYGYREIDSTIYRRAQQTDYRCTDIAAANDLPGSDWVNLNGVAKSAP